MAEMSSDRSQVQSHYFKKPVVSCLWIFILLCCRDLNYSDVLKAKRRCISRERKISRSKLCVPIWTSYGTRIIVIKCVLALCVAIYICSCDYPCSVETHLIIMHGNSTPNSWRWSTLVCNKTRVSKNLNMFFSTLDYSLKCAFDTPGTNTTLCFDFSLARYLLHEFCICLA